jgi:hypothetical protein
MSYRVLEDGEGVELRSGERFRLVCCDCGLTHNVVIVARGRAIGIARERNQRATAARRRKKLPRRK